jgi:hypothetical protein
MRFDLLTKKVGIWLFIVLATIPAVLSSTQTALAVTQSDVTNAASTFAETNIIAIERQPSGADVANVYSANGRDTNNPQQSKITVGGTDYWFTGFAGQATIPSNTNNVAFQVSTDPTGRSSSINPNLYGANYSGTFVTLPDGRRVMSQATVSTNGFDAQTQYKGVQRAGNATTFNGPPTPADTAALAEGGAGGEISNSSGFGCQIFFPSTIPFAGGVDTEGVLRCFVLIVYNFIAWPISVLLGIAAKMFNFIFAQSLGISGGSASTAMFATQFVKDAWVAVRDLINITFIFALLQVAILLIVGKSGGYQDRLKNIITAAVFINFSYFIVTEIIKLFNNLTIAIYNQIAAGGNLADAFTMATGISGFNTVSQSLVRAVSEQPAQLIFYLLFSSVLMAIFIVVMMFSAVLFLVRYIALVMCVIFSPVLFLGMIWPGATSKAKELENTIKGQLLFPILYLLLIWISINFIQLTNATSDITAVSKNIDKLTAFADDMQALVFNFGVATALMISSLVIAKKYSTLGSSYISSAQKWTGAAIGKTVFSPAASVGRATVGRVGGRVLQGAGASLQTLGTSRDSGGVAKIVGALGGRAVGRSLQLGGDKVLSSSFDVRGARVYQAVGGSAGMKDIYGKAKEGGYAKEQKDKAEVLEKRRNQVKALTTSEVVALDKAQIDKKKKDDAAEAAFKTKHKESSDAVKERISRIKNKQKEWSSEKTDAQNKAKSQTSKLVEAQKMKVQELESRRSAINASGNAGAHTAELADIAQKMSALEWKKNNKGKGQVGTFRGDAATLKNLKLDSFADQSEAIKTMQVEAEKAGRIAMLLGQKAYAESKKVQELEKEKSKHEDELKAAEKAIKSAGKARAGTYDKSIASNLNPFNIGNSLINSSARQQYFAKVREEAASRGKKGGKGK